MNIESSKKLLFDLNHKRNPQIPLIHEIHRIFIPSWNQKSLIRRESIYGRITQRLLHHQLIHKQRQHTLKIVLEAFSTLNAFKETSQIPLDLQHQLNKIAKETQSDLTNPPRLSEDLAFVKQEQVRSLEEEKFTQFTKVELLLNQWTVTDSENAPEAFKKLFVEDTSDQTQQILSFIDYLKLHPQESIVDFENEAQYLKKSLEDSQDFEQSLISNPENIETPEKRQDCYSAEAKKMATRISLLKENERWLYCGEFSNTHHSLIGCLQLVHKATKQIKNVFPETISQALEKIKHKHHLEIEIEKHLREAISNYTQEIINNPVTRSFQFLSANFIKEFFGSIEKFCGRLYPKGFMNEFGLFIEAGIVEAFDSLSDTKDLISSGLKVIQIKPNDPNKEEIKKNFNENIFNSIYPHVKQIVNQFEKNSSEMTKPFHLAIPRTLESTFDLRLARSLFWIECFREKDSFTIHIYSTGYLNEEISSNKHSWPKIIKNIALDKLSEDFFKRLLFLLIEPGFDNFAVNRETIENGLLSYLEGKIQHSKFVSKAVIDSSSSPIEVILRRLLKNPENLKFITWKHYINAFMLKLKSHYQLGQNRLILSSQDGIVLLNAINVLIEKRKALDDSYDDLNLNQLKLIQTVITDSLPTVASESKSSNPLDFPHIFLEILPELISVSQLRASKIAMTWAFGEEARELIDLLIETIGAQPIKRHNHAPIEPKPNSVKKGLLERAEFFRIKIAYYLISGTINLIELSYIISKIYKLNTLFICGLLIRAFNYFELRKSLPLSVLKSFDSWYDWCLSYSEIYNAGMTEIQLHSIGFLNKHLSPYFPEIYKELNSKLNIISTTGNSLFQRLLPTFRGLSCACIYFFKWRTKNL